MPKNEAWFWRGLTFWPYNIAKCRISRISTYLHQEVSEQDLKAPCCQMDVSETGNISSGMLPTMFIYQLRCDLKPRKTKFQITSQIEGLELFN